MNSQPIYTEDSLLHDPIDAINPIDNINSENYYNENFNNSQSGYIFNTTLPQSDFEIFENDFSQLINSKWDDIKSNLAYLDLVESINKKSVSTSNFINNKNELNNKKEQIFYVRKIHSKICSHRKNKLILKVKKNKIKMLIKEDAKILSEINCNHEIKFKFLEKNIPLSDKSEEILNKNTQNRNFRLFHKDVIIKKIMSNYLKFLRLILQNYAENFFQLPDDNKKKSIKINLSPSVLKICSLDISKKFLNKTLKDLIEFNNIKIQGNNKIRKNIQNFTKFSCLKLKYIFSNFFLHSNYFTKYLIERIETSYDKEYVNYFMYYINKLKNFII